MRKKQSGSGQKFKITALVQHMCGSSKRVRGWPTKLSKIMVSANYGVTYKTM